VVPKRQHYSEEESPERMAGGESPVEGARKAPDGQWYLPDPNRPGKYLRVE
jgi:hypothetical protein